MTGSGRGGGAPRWTRRLLERLARPAYADEVIGDLEEAHRDRVARLGRVVTFVLTSVESLDIAVALWRERRRAPVLRPAVHERDAPGAPARRGLLALSWLDFKLGLRMLARYPGLTVVGGVAMACGIAAGAGLFEFMKDAAFPELPYPGAERLVRIVTTSPEARTASPTLHDWEVDATSCVL